MGDSKKQIEEYKKSIAEIEIKAEKISLDEAVK